MKQFVLATGNPDKVREFSRLLHPLSICITTPKELGVSMASVVENGNTFAENAKIKAMYLYKKTGLPTIADDSGLVVDAIGGEPGIYSARYGGEDWTAEQQMALVLEKLGNTPKEKRTARFACHICCVLTEVRVLAIEATCEGYIGTKPLGKRGFGYDPIFMVGEESFAQMTDQEKDRVGHRGKATRNFVAKLEETLTILKENL